MATLTLPRSECRNDQVTVTGDIVNVPNDVDILTYTDTYTDKYGNDHTDIWCFEVQEIDYLLTEKRNPWNRKELPDYFISFLIKYKDSDRYKDMLDLSKVEEEEIEDKSLDIRRMKDKINEHLNNKGLDGTSGDPYIDVDTFISILKENPSYVILPIEVNKEDTDSVVRYLYNNLNTIVTHNWYLVYLIVKVAYLNKEISEEEILDETSEIQLEEFKKILDKYFYVNYSEQIEKYAKEGNVEGLKELRRSGATKEDAQADSNYALRWAANEGYTEVLRVLHEFYGLTKRDAQTYDNEALIWAAGNGNVEVLKVLHDLYGLGKEDAQAQNNYALESAAYGGHPEVLKILHDLYGLRKEDAQVQDNTALKRAAENGHVEVLKVLHDVYRLGKEDAQAMDNYAIRWAARDGHAVVLKVLEDYYGLRKEDAQAKDNEALRWAAENGHVEVLKVLHDLYGLRKEDAQADNNYAFKLAIENNRAEVLKVLREYYDVY